MVPLFHGSVDGWFPAQSPLSHLQLIIPSPSFFPGSSPLILLCLFPFFHCFNASCQIESLQVTALSFLDYRALEVLGFFKFLFPLQPHFPLFSSWTSSFLSSCFFFSVLSMMVALFTSFLCVLMIVARSSWHPGGRKESTRHSTRSLCSPGTCQEAPGIHTPAMHGYQWLHLVFEI